MVKLLCIAVLLLAGCRHRDASLRGVHILGIGWVHDRLETNEMRAFVIGNLSAGSYQMLVSGTNVPAAKVHAVNRNPLGVSVQAP